MLSFSSWCRRNNDCGSAQEAVFETIATTGDAQDGALGHISADLLGDGIMQIRVKWLPECLDFGDTAVARQL